MFDKLMNEHPDLQVIFVPGDIVAHAIAEELPPLPSYKTADYDKLLETTEEVSKLFNSYFPNAVVLITEGNNDTRYHYNPAWPLNDTADKENPKWAQKFYSQTFTEFFTNHTANKNLPEMSEIEETYNQGGYYRVEIADHLHVLSVNSLCYNATDGTYDVDLKTAQLEWLTDAFTSSDSSDKFILLYHIYETS